MASKAEKDFRELQFFDRQTDRQTAAYFWQKRHRRSKCQLCP